MPAEWLAAYQAGLFTEFMEQRAAGHTALDGQIYRKGMLGNGCYLIRPVNVYF